MGEKSIFYEQEENTFFYNVTAGGTVIVWEDSYYFSKNWAVSLLKIDYGVPPKWSSLIQSLMANKKEPEDYTGN